MLDPCFRSHSETTTSETRTRSVRTPGFVKFSELTYALRVAQTRDGEMRMKRTRFTREPLRVQFLFNCGVKCLQAGGLRTDPENAWAAVRRE